MKQYNEICKQIITEGSLSRNRTGMDTLAIFGCELRVDLATTFPAITCKRAFVRGAIAELNWMLSGSTNVSDLHERNVHFWDQWAIKGVHSVPKTPNELLRELKAGIAMTDTHKDVDDRVVYRVPSIDDIKTFLVGKVHPDINNGVCLSMVSAQRLLHSIWDMFDTGLHFTEITVAIADYVDEKFGGFYVPYTEAALVIAVMEAIDVTRKEAIELVGCRPIEEVVEEYLLPKCITCSTCEVGDLGPVYGANWRHWKTSNGEEVDQISQLVNNLKSNPTSRRHVLSFWNIEHLPDERYTPQENVARGKMALAPCHWMCEFDVTEYTRDELLSKYDNMLPVDGTYDKLAALCKAAKLPTAKLNIHPHMRSWDFPAGAPVNLVFYAALCHMLAQQCNLDVGELWYTGTNVHMYLDQVEIMEGVLQLEERDCPTFKLTEHPNSIFEYSDTCYELIDYNPHPTVSVPVAL